MKNAQATVEYLFLVGLLIILLIPLFYYGTSSSSEVKIQRADDTVQTLAQSAENVYYLGVGNKVESVVSIPEGVLDYSIENNTIRLVLRDAAKATDIDQEVSMNITGNLPITPGTYRMIAESSDAGVCIYPKGHKSEVCYCFENSQAAPEFIPLDSGLLTECVIDGGSWGVCDETTISYDSTIDQIRTRCHDDNNNIQSVRYSVYADGVLVNGPISGIHTPGTEEYVLNTPITIHNSGEIKLYADCRDYCFGIKPNVVEVQSFSISWGVLIPYLINPTTLQEVTPSDPVTYQLHVKQGDILYMNVGVKCVGGECKEINASLDPR